MRKKHYACNVLLCGLIAASADANAYLTVAEGQIYDNAPAATVFTPGSTGVNGTFNNRGRIDSVIRVQGTFNNYKSVVSNWLYITPNQQNTTSGVFNNAATGVVNIDYYLGIYAGRLENDGLIHFLHRPDNTSSFQIGYYTQFQSAINNRGEIRVDTKLRYAFSTSGRGKINNWGTLKITANNEWLAQSYYYQYEGQTVVDGKFSMDSTNILGGTLSGNGTISGVINIGNAATISPGDSIGTLTIDGDFNFSNSSLLIEIGGKAANLSDRLAVNGNADLSGTLNVILAKGFTPSAGDSFDIVTANSVTGDFATVNLPSLPNGLTWDIQTLVDRVRLTVL